MLPRQEILLTLRTKFLPKKTTYPFARDAALGIVPQAGGLLRAKPGSGPQAKDELGRLRPASWGSVGRRGLGAHRFGVAEGRPPRPPGESRAGGRRAPAPPSAWDVRPGTAVGPAPPHRRGRGRRPFSQPIKGCGPPPLASAPCGSARLPSALLELALPTRLHSTFSGLGYSGCGGRWRLRPTALRRRWLLPWLMCPN